ncbi:MAG: DUF502 domain-containing protein [Campylobacterales bacterium]|nr:DUF502 domain-containing protein [Campylobacterales bacterium]
MIERVIKGFLSLIPIIVVIAVFNYFFEIVENLFNFMFGITNNNLIVTISIFIVSISLLYYIGYLVEKNKKFILLKFTEKIVNKIPIAKTVYKIVKDIVELFSSNNSENYLGVVYVKVGNAKMIGFVTQKNGTDLIVFVPTTPNPTTGLLFLFDESDVEHCDLSMEEAFKLIISIGVNKV